MDGEAKQEVSHTIRKLSLGLSTEDRRLRAVCPSHHFYRKWNLMNKKICLFPLIVSLMLLSSCTSLQSIHKYGTFIHKTVAEAKPVAEDFYTSCMRIHVYRDCWKPEDCETEKQASKAILTVAKVLDAYGAALSTLSSDQLGNYDVETKNLTNEINNLKSEKINKARVQLIGKLANLVADAATKGYQQKQLTIFISDCNDAVMSVSNTLADLIGTHYIKAIEIEMEEWRNTCREAEHAKENNYFEWVAFSKEQFQYLIKLQAKADSAENLAKNIRNIGKTHAKLKQNLNNLSGKEVAEAVKYLLSQATPAIHEIETAF